MEGSEENQKMHIIFKGLIQYMFNNMLRTKNHVYFYVTIVGYYTNFRAFQNVEHCALDREALLIHSSYNPVLSLQLDN